MIDTWSAAEDLVYEILIRVFTLAAGSQIIPIGPTAPAPFNVDRPTKIENASILIGLANGDYLTEPMRIIPEEEWLAIPDIKATGNVPDKLYYDSAIPNANLNLHPIPKGTATSTQLALGVWQSIGQIATLATTVNLPPAYWNALVLGLQLALIPTYARLVPAETTQVRTTQFRDAIAAVRDLNSKIRMKPLAPVSPAPAPQPAAQRAQ